MKNDLMFHYIIKLHVSLAINQKLFQLGLEVFTHTPYSSDQHLFEFFFFFFFLNKFPRRLQVVPMTFLCREK